jgi:DNA-binding NarL/FixJ family response regulator
MLTKKISLGIVADGNLFGKILTIFLSQQSSLQIATQTGKMTELLHRLKYIAVDILVIDVSMVLVDGGETLKHVRIEYPHIKIIIVPISMNSSLIKEFLDLNIHAFISEEDDPESLLQAIISASENKIYRNKIFTDALYSCKESILEKGSGRSNVQFDERERKILQLLWEEKSNKAIANEIFLSVRSVEKIRQDMKEKLGAKSTIGLLKYALANKLIHNKNATLARLQQG